MFSIISCFCFIFKLQDGVTLRADTRATEEPIVCGVGTAADRESGTGIVCTYDVLLIWSLPSVVLLDHIMLEVFFFLLL